MTVSSVKCMLVLKNDNSRHGPGIVVFARALGTRRQSFALRLCGYDAAERISGILYSVTQSRWCSEGLAAVVLNKATNTPQKKESRNNALPGSSSFFTGRWFPCFLRFIRFITSFGCNEKLLTVVGQNSKGAEISVPWPVIGLSLRRGLRPDSWI